MEDPRTLQATSELKWANLVYDPPYTPWHAAHFLNDGPSGVEISINYPDHEFIIKPNKSKDIEQVINIIYYKCSPGLEATIKVRGVY